MFTCMLSFQVQQNTTDPSWQETFEFDVAKEELDMRYFTGNTDNIFMMDVAFNVVLKRSLINIFAN